MALPLLNAASVWPAAGATQNSSHGPILR